MIKAPIGVQRGAVARGVPASGWLCKTLRERAQLRMLERAGQALTRLGVAAAHPLAFAIVLGYGALWFVFHPATFEFHAAATILVWLMTLFIQRAAHRDMQAIHAKLDELLRADSTARSDLAAVDRQEPEQIEESRSAAFYRLDRDGAAPAKS